jgi:riboflavin biosynthesis protein RibD
VPRRADDKPVDVRRAEELMRLALAETAGTRPHPNPRVGAVVVSPEGRIVAARAHEAAGLPHAEVLALADAGAAARGGTLVVTLEPCDHHGRTPPCTTAIVAAGIARVVVGAPDPDPRVRGRGVARLRAAGIEVHDGVLADVVEANDPGYFHQRRHGRSRVTLKLAATLDGQAAAADGTSRWITGTAARRDAHLLRAAVDAVLVGAGTLRADDPRLDVRLEGYEGPQPRPVVVAGGGDLPAGRALYARHPLVYRAKEGEVPAGTELVVVAGNGVPDPATVLEDLASRGFLDVLLEGGPTLAAAWLHAGVVDRLVLYLGARLGLGTGLPVLEGRFPTIAAARPVRIDAVTRLGDDLRIDVAMEVS